MDHQLDFLAVQDRAREADSLLGHKVFKEAIEAMRQDLLMQIAGLPLGSERLQLLHVKLKLIDEVVGALRSFVADVQMRKSHA